MKSLLRAQFTRLCTTQLVLTLMLLSSGMIFAQHGIGTNNPNPAAALHVDGVEQGVLLPKTTLASSTQFLGGATATTADNGMVVYNTSNMTINGLSGEGYYVWKGGAIGEWNRLRTRGSGDFLSYRTHSLASSITWTDEDSIVIITNDAMHQTTLFLPDATLYPGRIITIVNRTSITSLRFGFGPVPGGGLLSSHVPVGFITIGINAGYTYFSDGINWLRIN